MATVRVTGTRQVNSQGNNTIKASNGPVIIDSTQTNITGKLVLGNILDSTSTVIINKDQTANVGNPVTDQPPFTIYGTPEQRQAGSVYIPGGLGIEKDLNVGGYIYGRVALATSSSQLTVQANNNDATFYPVFANDISGISAVSLYGDNRGANTSTLAVNGLTYNPLYGRLNLDRLRVNSTDTSLITATNNSVYVAGGVSVTKDLSVGGNIHPVLDNSQSIGSTTSNFMAGFMEQLYTKIITSNEGGINIAPAGGGQDGYPTTNITGDIRVQGRNPIGTAPVVTNVLYVTIDGDDTNDGRAQDPSRACRTIGGAIKSQYYQPGTQILVSAGHYLENNPIRLKAYTSVRGSDIRTTFIEPINKTQDLFHLESGCYLNYMTFINGRSGLLEGQYADGFNRGAYATAFPPITSNSDKIDLFHSPYIQNCTNQSGPWLRDGTMFVPDQTVQVPSAVATGTWVANTSSITVTLTTGTISNGMSINAGQQNPGFFNARTLLLANKPFLQEQVVAYVNQTYPGFVYNRELCFRDVGIIVENIAYDTAFGGNEKSREAGLAYYRGVVSVIAGQETQTVGAINYINSLTQKIIVNSTVTDLLSGSGLYSQVINTALTGGSVASSSINNLVGIITTIINNGPSSAPDLYNSTGPDAAYVSAEILLQANRKFIQEDTINWINNTYQQFPYNRIKCQRDAGIIVDSIASDLLYQNDQYSQSTFAGLQYWRQGGYVGQISTEITTTTQAISYLQQLAVKVITGVTSADDALVGVHRYSTSTQTTSTNYGTSNEVSIINSEFQIILDILKGNTQGWTDKIIPNNNFSSSPSIYNAYSLLQNNIGYFQDEVNAYITSTATGGLSFTTYNTATCRRDIGYIINSICFDLAHGGNRQAIQSGLSYYTANDATTTSSYIVNETAQTAAAFNFLASVAGSLILGNSYTPLQTKIKPVLPTQLGTSNEVSIINQAISTITNIITATPGTVLHDVTPITMTATTTTSVVNSYNIIKTNRDFIAAEVVEWIDQQYNPTSFKYNEELCYRDTGLIVDAVSQDILLGGNQKSLEAALSYWNQGYNYVSQQLTTTTNAINHARDIALQIIANQPVSAQTGTLTAQVINPFFQYGDAYMPRQAVSRNFGIITNIINNGPGVAPPLYAGGGLFALTGLNGSDVTVSPTITSITTTTNTGTYIIGLSTSTIGFGNNATLYIGDTHIFPLQNDEVDAQSYALTGNTSTWSQRQVDPVGSMGGSLVDGAVISDRSPIQSFVYDAFTQVNQGGKGIHVTNNGYAQLVSVFTIFCSVGVQCDNGGIASITNSNCNFGDLSLVAKGYGTRTFSGTVFNPAFRSYPFSPAGVDGGGNPLPYLDQFYPTGYWPNRGSMEVFVPDSANRPHIGQVMEVIPPEGHINEQGLGGFLNVYPSTSTLHTGTITLTDIDTTDIYIGNTVYIRDQFGSQHDSNGVWYAATGTVVTDVNYNSISLNYALTSGGGDPTNSTYFTLYFCGNSYYTVQTSSIADQPYAPGHNILSANTSTYYQGPSTSQITAHIKSLQYLNTLTDYVIANIAVPSPLQSTVTQVISTGIAGGINAKSFIDLRFNIIENIINAPDITSAEMVIPQKLITTNGPVPLGAGSAINLIESNMDFMAEEVSAFVQAHYSSALAGSTSTYSTDKCRRDVKLILQQIIYDLQSGGNYNSVYSGLSYWSRPGTYHVIELGEAVTRPDLFPDGSTVNFYQRSYISASGYLFEYVGAGTNYGALPQRGVADPVQAKETVQLNSGKVFFTSTDQNGDFRIGRGLVISQATGVLSGRTFVQSLYANMTPFILAIE